MPSSSNRDWSRVSGESNVALWDSGVVQAAGIWALALGALGLIGNGIILALLPEGVLGEEPLVLVSVAVSVAVALASLFFGYRLRTPSRESETHLTILIWLYALLLALSITEFIVVASSPEAVGAPGFFRFLILGLALRAFIRGKREMTDFPGAASGT